MKPAETWIKCNTGHVVDYGSGRGTGSCGGYDSGSGRGSGRGSGSCGGYGSGSGRGAGDGYDDGYGDHGYGRGNGSGYGRSFSDGDGAGQ